MKNMREMLKRSIVRQCGRDGQGVAVSLSGGIDSSAMVIVCVSDLGWKPRCYTYAIRGESSRDLNVARQLTVWLGLEHHVCLIEPEQLEEDVLELTQLRGITGKVRVQCMHGHLYVVRAMRRLKPRDKMILNGSGVDGLYGVYKGMAITGYKAFREGNRAAQKDWGRMRQKHLEDPNDDAMVDQRELYEEHGVKVIYAYREYKPIVDYLMSLNYIEMNTPRVKEVIRQWFPELAKFHVRRGSQQLVSGTAKLHERLLTSKLNKYGRRRMTEIYADLAAER